MVQNFLGSVASYLARPTICLDKSLLIGSLPWRLLLCLCLRVNTTWYVSTLVLFGSNSPNYCRRIASRILLAALVVTCFYAM